MKCSDAEVDRMMWIVDESGAARKLNELLRQDGRGRKSKWDVARAFLVGALLSSGERGSLAYQQIYNVLERSISRNKQWDLGLLRWPANADPATDAPEFMPVSRFYYFSHLLSTKLEYGDCSAAGVDSEELARSEADLFTVIDSMLDMTLPPSPSGSYAMDASAVKVWSRPMKHKDLEQAKKTLRSATNDTERKAVTLPLDPDAGWGVKTDNDGTGSRFFGYYLHAAVRVREMSQSTEDLPLLIERFGLTAANLDVVDVSLDIIDRMRIRGSNVKELICDRHYSFKTADRWAHELRKRNIQQVVDLHETDHGFTDAAGMRVAAGVPHCPCTPEHLAKIPRPGLGASEESMAAFQKLIDERETYAMRRVNNVNERGMIRWECPAIAGKVGCSLREGTEAVARELGIRTINTKGLGTPPTCCTNRTVSVSVDHTQPKLTQKEYWGSPRWQKSYNRRTHIEGCFGVLKNPSRENVTKGHTRAAGRTIATLNIGIALITYNLRTLRAWIHECAPEGFDHPLGRLDPTNYGHVELDEAGARAIDIAYAEQQAA